MSTNIHFIAERNIEVQNESGRNIEIERVFFKNIWQTPSVVTRQIMKSNNKPQTYKDWVLSLSKDVIVPIYDGCDIFGDGPIIDYRMYNESSEHIKDFDIWLLDMEKRGFNIVVESY
jgi:hypothetical protein